MSSLEFPPYSVLMSIYAKERPEYLREALDSMLAQTVAPAEVVVVKDGPLTPELEAVLAEYGAASPGLFSFDSYPENRGLGYALARGIEACSNEVVARMDTDDVARPERMERQLSLMADQGLDMVGSNVTEFTERFDRPVATTDLPMGHDEIVAYSKRRNPFRHPPMTFRKSKVLAAGNYNGDFPYFEDWDLFNRMLASGCRAANLPEPLVAMRVSPDFYMRRGGSPTFAACGASRGRSSDEDGSEPGTSSPRPSRTPPSASCRTVFGTSCTAVSSGGAVRAHERDGHEAPRTVAFVILTWNSGEYVRPCLESVLGLGGLCSVVYVVDNGSADGTLAALGELAAGDERLRVLPQERNLGTTASRNIAIREVLAMSPRPSYICVLDSDTVANAAALGSAMDALEADPSIAVAGPTLASADGAPQLSGCNLPTFGIKLRKACPARAVQARGEAMEVPSAFVHGGVQDVGYLISACWVTPTWVWERVGLLDEEIFYAPEDVDWCVRCHAAGLRVVRVHGEPMVHHYQRISKRRMISRMNWEHVKGLVYYFRKHRYLFDASKAQGGGC